MIIRIHKNHCKIGAVATNMEPLGEVFETINEAWDTFVKIVGITTNGPPTAEFVPFLAANYLGFTEVEESDFVNFHLGDK